MILLSFAGLVFVIQIVLWCTYRGTWEFHRLTSTRGKQRYQLMLSNARAAGLDIDDCSIDSSAFKLRAMATLSYGPVLVLPMLFCYILSIAPSIPTWACAIAPGVIVAFTWVVSLLLSHAMGVSPVRFAKWSRIIVMIIGSALVAACIWLAVWLCFGGLPGMRRLIKWLGVKLPDVALCGLGAIGMFALLAAAYGVFRLTDRIVRVMVPPNFDAYVARGTVLCLRSKTDSNPAIYSPSSDSVLRTLLWPRLSFEELMTYGIKVMMGIEAVQRPGGGLPQSGVVHSFRDDQRWRESFRLSAIRCHMVVLAVGADETLQWEIEHLKSWGLLSKCLFMVPPMRPAKTRIKVDAMLCALGVPDEVRQQIPELLDMRCIIAFKIRPNGDVRWITNSGREWLTYGMQLHRATADEVVRDGGPGLSWRPSGDHPEVPDLPPDRAHLGIRQAVRRSSRAMDYMSRGRYDEAVAGLSVILKEERARSVIDQAAVAYLLSMMIVGGRAAGQWGWTLSVMEDLITVVQSQQWVWVDAKAQEPRRSADVIFATLSEIATIKRDAGDLPGCCDALQRRQIVAQKMPDKHIEVQAGCELASVLMHINASEAKTLADQMRTKAAELGDADIVAQADHLLAM